MIVTVDIPDEFNRYLEFIPEEELPCILLSALKEKIDSSIPKPRLVQEQFNLQDLVSLLNIAQGTGSVTAAEPVLIKEESNESAEKTQSKIINFTPVQQVVQDIDESDDDLDDMDDFMDLMK